MKPSANRSSTNQASRKLVKRRPARRRGSLYLAVLSVTMIVSMVALSAMHAARLQIKTTQQGERRQQARLLALSAIEHALAEFNSNRNWESDYNLGTEYPNSPVPVNDGEFTWKLVATTGGGRRLDGIGRHDGTECILSVDLKRQPNLDHPLLVGGDLTVGANDTLTINDSSAVVHGTVTNNGSITGNVEANAFAGLGALSGTQTSLTTERVLPNKDRVFDYYLAVGTYLNIPVTDNLKRIRKCLLSPNSNPFGATNPHGIYIVDAGGYSVRVKDSRIVGTLVVVNGHPTETLRLRANVCWEPAYPTFPAMLVDGNILFESDNIPLDESAIDNPNLNPFGTPFQGNTDSVRDDSYPSSIAGLIYCTGDMQFDGRSADRTPERQGVSIVGGDCQLLNLQTHPIFDYDAGIAALPPPGFGDGQFNGPSNIAQHSTFTSRSNDQILFDKHYGTYVDLGLPGNTLKWRMTRLRVWVRKYVSGSLHVVNYTPKSDGTPDAVIEDVSIPFGSLPASFGWVEVPISSPGNWMPGDQNVCICLEGRGADQPAELEYSGGGAGNAPSGLLQGNGSWNPPETGKSIGFILEGEYTTWTGNAVSIIPGTLRQTDGS